MLSESHEQLSKKVKARIGDQLITLIRKDKKRDLKMYYWALSRIGARIQFHGSIDRVVSSDVAERWIKEIIETEWVIPRDVSYAITQLSRRTDDRSRDINDTLRNDVIKRLSQYEWTESLIKEVREALPLSSDEEKNIFGESLPVGLYIS